MLYILDANILINAKNHFYQFDRVPEFWEWLVFQGKNGFIKIPIEIYEEFKVGKVKGREEDKLSIWSKEKLVKEALLMQENAEPDLVNDIVTKGYLVAPSEQDIETIGRDPFLISYASKDKENRCIVTAEVSRPKRIGANRHIPDVCRDLKISCCNAIELINALDFSTSWKAKI